MIDTHCHLNWSPLSEDLQGVQQNARDVGVSGIIVIGTDLDTSRQAVTIATQLDKIWASIGLHPDTASPTHEINTQDIARWQTKLASMLPNPKVVAIGECGLDYVELHEQSQEVAYKIKNQQKQLFGMQIQLAKEFKLPLSIHCRNTKNAQQEPAHNLNAYADLIDTLEHFSKNDGVVPSFILHCMSGGPEYLREGLRLGGFISFAGNVTYPSAQSLRDLLHLTPLDRLLLETDAPFLSPKSKRGTPNTPANIAETFSCVANELGIAIEELDKVTTTNAQKIFHLT